MAYRIADAIIELHAELDATWPGRDTSSDGGIGDARHAAQGSASDHNPWVKDPQGRGVVRAYDIDVDLDGSNDGNGGQALEDLREHLRALGEAGDPRLQDHGYVISNGKIASEKTGWEWAPHTKDPHFDHIHVSVARNQAGYDGTGSWGIAAVLQPASPQPSPQQEDDDMNGRAIINHDGHIWIFRRGDNSKIYFSRDGGKGDNRIEDSSIGSAPSAVEVNGVLIVGGKGSTDDRFWAARHKVGDGPDKWTWGAEDQ